MRRVRVADTTPGLGRYVVPLCDMGPAVHSDEEDFTEATEAQEKISVRLLLPWRSQRLTELLHGMDRIFDIQEQLVNKKAKLLIRRIQGTQTSKRLPPAGLPIDAYNRDWMRMHNTHIEYYLPGPEFDADDGDSL